jgi:hypothetical protein
LPQSAVLPFGEFNFAAWLSPRRLLFYRRVLIPAD